MDQWLETKQLPVHFVSVAGVVYKKTGDMFGSLRLYEDVGYYRRHAVIDLIRSMRMVSMRCLPSRTWTRCRG